MLNMHQEIKLLIHMAKSKYLPHRIAPWGSTPLVVRVVLLDEDHAEVAVVEIAALHNHVLLVMWSGRQVPKAACQV
jgi:hypothetical protein